MYFTYLLYRGKQRQSRKPLLFIWYVKINNIAVKNIYFNSFLMFDLLVVIYEFYIGERFSYSKRLSLARINLFNLCLRIDLLAIIYDCSTQPNTLYASINYEMVTLLHPFFRLAITLFMLDF